ncbi:MAG TPA: hypothetical protein DCW60_04475 [Sutterella sp.]|nr:hypothetical protein [Sutterella sp.]
MLEFPIKLAFCAPSRTPRDADSIPRIESFFTSRGAEVFFDEACSQNVKQFSGTDEARAASFIHAVDTGASLVMPIRGGYGLSRILGAIDYDYLARKNPIFCGYSDFTAFNLAYFAKTGKVTFQGPAGTDFIDEPPYATLQSFKNALFNQEWVLSFTSKSAPKLDFEGTLWGGNLSMITSLVGSPYLPIIDNGILFLEDGNERAYRIERMLLTLLHAGVLARQRVILLGDFRDADPVRPREYDFLLSDVLEFLVAALPDTVIITGLPFGHDKLRATIPVGAKARIRTEKGYVLMTSKDKPTISLG